MEDYNFKVLKNKPPSQKFKTFQKFTTSEPEQKKNSQIIICGL